MKSIILSLLLISVVACASDTTANDLTSNMQEVKEEGEVEAKTEQMYSVRFISLWNRNDHISTPGNAHFSPIVAAIHNNAYSLFPKGEFASPGFKSVAEFGQTRTINSELSTAINNGAVGSSLNTENQFIIRDNQIEQTFLVTATKEHGLLSFISMIAPSPDWVVGVSNLELYNSQGFISEDIEMDLHAYHAGTQEGDVGGNFNLGRQATVPVQPISKLSGNGLDAAFARVIISPVN